MLSEPEVSSNTTSSRSFITEEPGRYGIGQSGTVHLNTLFHRAVTAFLKKIREDNPQPYRLRIVIVINQAMAVAVKILNVSVQVV